MDSPMTEAAIGDWVVDILRDSLPGACILLTVAIIACICWWRKTSEEVAKLKAERFGQDCENYRKSLEIGVADSKFRQYLAMRQDELYDVGAKRAWWLTWVWNPVLFLVLFGFISWTHGSLSLGWYFIPANLLMAVFLFRISVSLSYRCRNTEKYIFDV